jgi:outer membrane immunogenic protein
MKRYFLGCTALVVLAGVANAADMPTKAMPVKAPPVVSYDWTGFYIGGYFGDAIGNSKTRTDPGTVASQPGVNRLNDKELTAGGTLGYNWQFNRNWLIGLEGDIGWMGINRTEPEWNDRALVGFETDWYATLRGRLGYVTGPSLLYVTGGAAFVHGTDTFGGGAGFFGIPLTAAGLPATTNTSTQTGWTVGGGIETKLSRSWSAKTEYLFIDTGHTSFGADPYSIPGTPTTVDHTYHVIKTGLNYKFGEPFMDGLPLFGTSSMLPSDHNWGGFYAGVNVGGGISNVHTIGGSGTQPGGSEEDLNGTGFAGGGHVGYNLMNIANFLGSSWFVGLEGDIGYLGVRQSENDWFDTAFTFQDKTNWYATARGRVGTSTGPALLYATGGAAWVNLTDTLSTAAVANTASGTASGWTFGGGAEVALDSRWSARIESLYIDVGHQQLAASGGFSDFKDRFTVVRAGLTYQFGGVPIIGSRY